MIMSKKRLDILKIKLLYPAGTRIRLIHMSDTHAVPSGMLGTVTIVDDMGTIHMHWDNGRTLGLVFGEDEFEIVD